MERRRAIPVCARGWQPGFADSQAGFVDWHPSVLEGTRPPNPTVVTGIGSDPGQVRITPDGKSYAYTYWTFEGELYLARGIK